MIFPTKTKATLTAIAALTGAASAAIQIYEPFDYADTGPINNGSYLGDGNQSGALGLTGNWNQVDSSGAGVPVNEIDVRSTGLTFGALPTTGGQITRDNRVGQNAAWSSVSASATNALTADGSSMWMSFLFQDRGFSGPDSVIALSSERMIGSDSQALVAAGFGVGVGVNSTGGQNRNIQTIVYNGGTGLSATSEATPTFNGPGSSGVHLLVMKVNWNTSGTNDEIFVWDVTDINTEPTEGSALATATFDWTQLQQNSLDTLAIGDTQVERWDEIRLGTSFDDVMGVITVAIPEPSSMTLLGLGGLLLLRRRRC